MNRYDQIWDTVAEDELADIWRNSPNKSMVVRAAAAIDKQLSQDPHGHGAHLSEGLWEITVPPIRVYYQIDDTNKEVIVRNVNEVA